MIEPPPHPQEAERLKALRGLALLDTPLEERFERITRMVCRSLDVPIALFNLIDEDRQHYKSVHGLAATNAALDAAFCTHAILEADMLLVPDASKDARFHDNPFVTGERLNVGFYAGCPVRTPSGLPIGTVCAIDTRPRDVTPDQLAALRDLAAIIESELKLVSLSRAQATLIEQLDTASRLSMIDPLTRLWNRSGLENLLEKEWSDAARHGRAVTLVMTDIDHFKSINDTFGHPGGDAVLRGFAKRLLEALRGEDTVGRTGGEEFLMILTDCAADKRADTVERIRRVIADTPFDVGGVAHPVTASFGVASGVPGADVTPESLIAAADAALYQAKRGGRNRVVVAE